jgi:hypothetical protein
VTAEELLAAERDAMGRRAWLHMRGYHGTTRTPVRIVFGGETPTRYRVRLTEDTRLPGRNRWGRAGDVVLVPKSAVAIDSGDRP